MVHPTNIKAGDSCHLDTPEYDIFKMFLAWFFSMLWGTEQAVSMHAVLLVDLTAGEWRQHESLPG